MSICPICASRNVSLQGLYRGSHLAFLKMKRAQCKNCDMVFADPMPSDSALAEFNASYFNNAHGRKPQAAATLAFFFGIARLRAAHVENYLRQNEISVSKVHEVGPGPGWFARSWMAQHPRTKYSAVETDASCHAALREIGVHLAPDGNPPVDLVVMTHVLEHVSVPAAFLLESTQWLRPGGVLFIEVPCRDWEHKSIDEPHLLFFDKEPMKRLLGNQGFEEIKLSYHGQKIANLRKASKVDSTIMALRSKLIGMGLTAPFGQRQPGMEPLTSSLERAVLAPYHAHEESAEPAWWLRAMAIKT